MPHGKKSVLSNNNEDDTELLLIDADDLEEDDAIAPLATPLTAYQRFLQNWHHADLLQGLPNFSLGFKLITFRLWPAMFVAVTASDLIFFLARPDDRYGNEIVKILTGISTNQLTFTSNLGSDRVGSYADFVMAGLIAAPVVNGMFWVGLGRVPQLERRARRFLGDMLGWFSNAYLAWSHGEHKSIVNNLFWPLSLMGTAIIAYIDGRYVWLAINKAANIYHYLSEKNACETQHNQFTYMLQSEQHECTVCGEWPFVSYRAAFAAQNCLDSLLAQNITPQILVNYLEKLQVPRNFSDINLSKQPWRSWSVQELDLVLTQIEHMLLQPAETFDISAKQPYKVSPEIAHLQRISQFLKQVSFKHINASNQGLRAETVQFVLHNNTMVTINLSGNPLEGVSAESIANFMNAVDLGALNIENTNMTVFGMQKIAQSNSTVAHLVLTGNPIDTQILVNLANNTLHNNLHTLVLGDTELPIEGLKKFCLQVNSATAKLRSLTIKNIHNFGGRHASALAPCMNKLEYLDVSYNPGLTTQEAIILLRSARNGTLSVINFGYCKISEISKVAAQLPLSIQQVDLSGNPAYANEYHQGILALSEKNITAIIINDIRYGDELGIAFEEAFANHTIVDLTIDFSRTRMTAAGAAAVFHVNGTKTIILSGNNLQGIGLPLAEMLLQNQQIKQLDVSYANLNATDLQQMVKALPGSTIETMVLAGNPNMGSETMLQLEEQLLKPMVHRNALGATAISVDLARAFHHAAPQTNINLLNISNSNLNATAILGFCRLNANLGIEMQLSDNPGTPAVNFHDCQISSSARLEVPYIFRSNISWLNNAHQIVIYSGLSSYVTVFTTDCLSNTGLDRVSVAALSKIAQLAVTHYSGGNFWIFLGSQLLEYSIQNSGFSPRAAQQIGVSTSIAMNLTNNISQYGYGLGSAYTVVAMTIGYASGVIGSGLAKITAAVVQPSCAKISTWLSKKMGFWQTEKLQPEVTSIQSLNTLKI